MKQLECRVCKRTRFFAYHEEGDLIRFKLVCVECGSGSL